MTGNERILLGILSISITTAVAVIALQETTIQSLETELEIEKKVSRQWRKRFMQVLNKADKATLMEFGEDILTELKFIQITKDF